jgi:hypothetical protein
MIRNFYYIINKPTKKTKLRHAFAKILSEYMLLFLLHIILIMTIKILLPDSAFLFILFTISVVKTAQDSCKPDCFIIFSCYVMFIFMIWLQLLWLVFVRLAICEHWQFSSSMPCAEYIYVSNSMKGNVKQVHNIIFHWGLWS